MSAEDIGSIYNTKVPGYADPADIQKALRVYHYGSDTYDPSNTDPEQLPTNSIAGWLNRHNAKIITLLTRPTGAYSAEQPDTTTPPLTGFLWLESDSQVNPGPTYATAIYTTTAPTQNLVDGIIWVDKSASPNKAYIYNAGLASWIPISEFHDIANNAGDMIYATSENHITILPIGTAGQILSVDPTTTLPTWQDGSAPIASGNIPSGGISLTGIPSIYKGLRLVIKNAYPSADAKATLNINSSTGISATGTSYTNTLAISSITANNIELSPTMDNTSFNSEIIVEIPEYQSNAFKIIKSNYFVKAANGTDAVFGQNFGVVKTTDAISSLAIGLDTGNYSGGTYVLYGVR